MKTLSTLSLTLFSTVSLLALSACGAPTMPGSARFASQAILPPDAISPKPCNGVNSQAALPPGYVTPKPCGCNGFQSQAALPPGLNPNHPSNPAQPWNPKPCKP